MVQLMMQFIGLVVVSMFLFSDFCLASESAHLASNQSAALDFSESASMARPEGSILTKADGIVMLDYEVIKVPGDRSIDLMGFHLLSKLNDWMYLGIGGYAPLFSGEYGGFMAGDITAHVQRRMYGNFFANAGLSLGGGGGGKSEEQSIVLSGTGGFAKGYLGMGYDFKDFSAGANLSRMKFANSAINNSQLNIFVQVPFSYSIGSYASSGSEFLSAYTSDAQGALLSSGENVLTLGFDNFVQIQPEGLYKGTINVADVQFSHFITKSSYWHVNLGVGYHGLPLYNHVLAGLGHRFPLSSNINVSGQLALGSGGYAPETINTGPGLLVYPKISTEYMFDKNLGVSLSAGYLFAPKGSSKNKTFGAALNYHLNSGDRGLGTNGTRGRVFHKGFRLNLFQQTEFDVNFSDKSRSNIKMLSVQLDNMIGNYLYIPGQVSVAYNDYLDKPGYGEILTGVGVQNKYLKGDRLQLFGQLLVGANVHGLFMKTGAGMNYGLSDRWALYSIIGNNFSVDKEKFRSKYAGFGVTHRFSVPSW